MRAGVLLYPDFDELDAVGPYEVLANAARPGDETAFVTADEALSVTGSHGMTVVPDRRVDETLDLLVVPGGGWVQRRGAFARPDDPATCRH